MKRQAFGILLLLGVVGASSASAALRESWVMERPVRPDEVSALNALLVNGADLTVQVADPSSYELEGMLGLRTDVERTLVLRRYPGFDLAEAVAGLAAQGWRLVVLEGVYPSETDIEILNSVLDRGPRASLTIGVAAFAGPDVFGQLAGLRGASRGQLQMVFATAGYPRFMDRDALRAAPIETRFQFYQNYWPSYIHMDVLNMLPQAIELRVRDMFPPDDEAYVFVTALQRLERLRLDCGQAPVDATMWEKFGAVNVEWVSAGYLPSAAELDALVASRARGARSLTLDSVDVPAERVAHLRALPVPVRWIRTLP